MTRGAMKANTVTGPGPKPEMPKEISQSRIGMNQALFLHR